MGKVTVTGMDLAFSRLSRMGQAVRAKGADAVKAAAQVLYEELYRTHPVDTGNTRDHMVIKGPNKTQDGYQCVITWNGKDEHGTRYGQVAFINEYGRKNAPAQPFIRPGEAAAADEMKRTMMETLAEGIE